MKKYLVAALVACLGILSVNAQVDKTIEVSQCEANNKLTVEGQTLISTSYGNLVFPENDYTNYTGINFEATNYNPQIQISAESETKRSIFREKDKTKRSKKESAQHSKSRNKSFVMTSVSAL